MNTISYGINNLRTVKDWAGVHCMVMVPYTVSVSDYDPTDLLRDDPSYDITLPSLVMGEEFVFLYSKDEVLAELRRLQAECDRHPGCTIKWIRHASESDVNRLWKE